MVALCQLEVASAVIHSDIVMLTRKDKRLSSARKRLMSQLGKRSRLRKSRASEEQSTTPGELITLQEANSQPPSHLAGNDNPEFSSNRCPAVTEGPSEVSDSLLESDSVPPSSDSEYFPTPEKRQRIAIMQQSVEAASLGRGMFVSLFTDISIFRPGQC